MRPKNRPDADFAGGDALPSHGFAAMPVEDVCACPRDPQADHPRQQADSRDGV